MVGGSDRERHFSGMGVTPPNASLGKMNSSDRVRAMENDDALIDQIAPDVLGALANKRFFDSLDDQMCPVDPAQPRLCWEGTYAISTTILARCGIDSDDIADITQVLAARGGHCDCEILFNVVEESRLKSEYWKARAAESAPPDSHHRHCY